MHQILEPFKVTPSSRLWTATLPSGQSNSSAEFIRWISFVSCVTINSAIFWVGVHMFTCLTWTTSGTFSSCKCVQMFAIQSLHSSNFRFPSMPFHLQPLRCSESAVKEIPRSFLESTSWKKLVDHLEDAPDGVFPKCQVCSLVKSSLVKSSLVTNCV